MMVLTSGLLPSIIFAQRNADLTVTYQQNIENIALDPESGLIIVKEKDKVSAYNPETNKTEWEVTKDEIGKVALIASAQNAMDALDNGDLLKLFESSDAIELIPESPFVRVILADKDAIINIFDGKIVFNSAKTHYRIIQNQYLQDENALLLIATDGKMFNCVWYDLNDGKEKWITKLSTIESLFSSVKSALLLKNNATEDKVEVTEDAVFTSINGNLYKINRTDGSIEWKTDYKINKFYLSQSLKSLIIIKNSGNFLSYKQALNILNASDGSMVWKNDISTKYISYLEDWSDKILVAHSRGFNFFSYADGKKIWKKDAKGDNIKRVIPIDKDYLYITGKEMNLIDNEGINKWKKTIEISDNEEDIIHFLDKVENGRVFYLTSTYGNMVDYITGKKIWKKNIEFEKDKPLLYVYEDKSGVFLVYNNKKIYKFDPNASDKPEPIAKLKEIKEDKSISGIELFDWGICLTGQSDVMGVNLDGTVRYHNTYKEPGGGSRKFLKTTGKIAAFGLGATSAISQSELVFYTRDKNGNLVETGRVGFDKKTRNQGQAAGGASELITGTLLSRVSDRFNALKQNGEYAFVLAKGDNGPVLVKVKKSDGTEVDKIDIDNNKPIYEVDPVTDDVFYVYKNEMRIFSKK
ncbi:MAG: PQQ-binding-like beta-propeller repeat protein [Dysgonamonadaceae bacterium]|nr:PQQ-binding-like beta-propeller repeat protein [Dysgonamonadaceae bacterium]